MPTLRVTDKGIGSDAEKQPRPAVDTPSQAPTCHRTEPTGRCLRPRRCRSVMIVADLYFHGDVAARGARWDFAVNVVPLPPPTWLSAVLSAAIRAADRYPDIAPVRAHLADFWQVPSHNVLLTAGASQAFTLVARARAWQHPVVVHPQFTEPHVALLATGATVESIVLRPDTGFTLDPGSIPASADLVILGNPTNPTGVYYDVSLLRSLCRPHRIVLVDEAFIDTVAAGDASLLQPGADLTGLIVVRSVTKQWAIPGVRAGFAVGDTELIGQMYRAQPAWSLGSAALAALTACHSDRAVAESARRTALLTAWREELTDWLDTEQIRYQPSQTSFVLAQLGAGMVEALAQADIAVRRCDTFPGLDNSWVRIAARPAEQLAILTHAVSRHRG